MNKFKEPIKMVIKYKDLITLLVKRDIKLKYRQSFLGYVWSVLNPLLIMIIMAIVFTTILKRKVENFAVYLFCGQMLFSFLNQSTNQALAAISSNSQLLKKVFVPGYIFVIAKVSSAMTDFVLSLIALILVMLVTGSGFSLWILLIWIPLIQLYFFCFGLGLVLSALNVIFKDIKYIYNAVVTAWHYLTPIIYPIDVLPDGFRWGIEHFNPLYMYIAQFRSLVYEGVMFDYHMMLRGIVFSVLACMLGILVFHKNQYKFVYYL